MEREKETREQDRKMRKAKLINMVMKVVKK